MTAPRMNSAESDTANGGEVPEARQHPGTDAPENPAEVETVVEVVEVVVEGDAVAEEPTPRSRSNRSTDLISPMVATWTRSS